MDKDALKKIEVVPNLFVSEKIFKDKEYVDIRKHFKDDNDKDVPTKKGIFIHRSIVCDVISVLGKMVEPKELTPIINEFAAIEAGESA